MKIDKMHCRKNNLNKISNELVVTDSKEYILAGLAEAMVEVKLARQGKIKGRPARELLREL